MLKWSKLSILVCALLSMSAPLSGAIKYAATYTGESWDTAGSINPTKGVYLDNFIITAEWQAEQSDENSTPESEGLHIFGSLLYNNGGSINSRVGDRFGVSNIETINAVRLYELWLEFTAPGDAEPKLKFGLYDLNTEFDVRENGLLFINSNFGIGADFSGSGEAGPSIFPLTSLAARIAWKPKDKWLIRLALLDAVPGDPDHVKGTRIKLTRDEGALAVVEAERSLEHGRLVFARWHYTQGNSGSYVFTESSLWESFLSTRKLSGLLRIGESKASLNEFTGTVQAALVLNLVFLKGDEDSLGLGLAYARNTKNAAAEFTYQFLLSDWLSIQPDIQYIYHPLTIDKIDHVWVFGLRFKFHLSKK